MKGLKVLVAAFQIARNHDKIVPEVKELYEAFTEGKKDGKLTLDETRRIVEELFDVLALAIPAFKEFRGLRK